MDPLVERALRLWRERLPAANEDALAAFAEVYLDPLDVNGSTTPLGELVDRARMLQAALDEVSYTMHDVVVTPGRRAFAFHITGRHVGPLTTPRGVVAPTGELLDVAGMDIFVVDEESARVVGVWAVADVLGALPPAALAPLVAATPGGDDRSDADDV